MYTHTLRHGHVCGQGALPLRSLSLSLSLSPTSLCNVYLQSESVPLLCIYLSSPRSERMGPRAQGLDPRPRV